jgi:hypothetical protein
MLIQTLFNEEDLTLCHVAGTLFVSRQDKFEVFRVVDGVKDRKDSTSGVSN